MIGLVMLFPRYPDPLLSCPLDLRFLILNASFRGIRGISNAR